jgi:hypothetical protein
MFRCHDFVLVLDQLWSLSDRRNARNASGSLHTQLYDRCTMRFPLSSCGGEGRGEEVSSQLHHTKGPEDEDD